MHALRKAVSKKKIRYIDDEFDLDLTYIKDNIIAMGFPSFGTEGMYRNPVDEVKRFLDKFHPLTYRVYNLCEERSYPPSVFDNRVEVFPFADHNPPPFRLIPQFCQSVGNWLQQRDNVVAVHCKAGKGRTGTMICAYLVHTGQFESAQAAIQFYGSKRTSDGKGVTIASQQRYVRYYERYLRMSAGSFPLTDLTLRLVRIRINIAPAIDRDGGSAPYFLISDQSKAVLFDMRQVLRPKHFVNTSVDIELQRSVPITGDIKFQFFSRHALQKDDKLFHFWINTNFVDANYVRLAKSELDGRAAKEKHSKAFSPEMTVELFFDGGPEISPPSAAYVQHKRAFKKQTAQQPSCSPVPSTSTQFTDTDSPSKPPPVIMVSNELNRSVDENASTANSVAEDTYDFGFDDEGAYDYKDIIEQLESMGSENSEAVVTIDGTLQLKGLRREPRNVEKEALSVPDSSTINNKRASITIIRDNDILTIDLENARIRIGNPATDSSFTVVSHRPRSASLDSKKVTQHGLPIPKLSLSSTSQPPSQTSPHREASTLSTSEPTTEEIQAQHSARKANLPEDVKKQLIRAHSRTSSKSENIGPETSPKATVSLDPPTPQSALSVVSQQSAPTSPSSAVTNAETPVALSVNTLERTASLHFNEAQQLQQQGDLERSVELYTRALEANPQLVKALNNRGIALLSLGKTERAIEDMSAVIALEPNRPSAYHIRGVAYKKLGNIVAADKCFTDAVRCDPQFAKAYSQRAAIAEIQKHYTAAVADYSQAISIQERNGITDSEALISDYMRRAAIYFSRLSKYANSIDDYTNAIALMEQRTGEQSALQQTERIICYLHRGLSNKKIGRVTAALSDFEVVCQLDADNSRKQRQKGLWQASKLYIEAGDHLNAEAALSEAIGYYETDRSSPSYNSEMAALQYERGIALMSLHRLQESVACFTKSIEIESNNNPNAFYNRGLIYHLLEDYDRAIGDFTRVLRLNPKDVDATLDRARAYIAKNEMRNAKADLRRILFELDSHHSEAKALLETVNQQPQRHPA